MSANAGRGVDNLERRYQDTLKRIRDAERTYHRDVNAVRLVAVSKTHPGTCIRALAKLGQHAFGESYLQEATRKAAELTDLNLQWHFIGHIQSNKCREIARLFDWVHSVDSFKVARRLSEARRAAGSELQVLLQVNIQSEANKSGVELEALPTLAGQVCELPGLRLRGLMAIPAPERDLARQRSVFARLRRALEGLNATGLELDCLSMGMTDDLEAAIAEGATDVRIGTAIFGPRSPAP